MEKFIDKISNMLHAIGYERKRITRSGYLNSYRNYFCTNQDDEVWEELVIEGYAIKTKHGNQKYYHVSDKGIQVLEKLYQFLYKRSK